MPIPHTGEKGLWTQVKRAIVPGVALAEGKTIPLSVCNQKLKMEGKLSSVSENVCDSITAKSAV